MCLVEGFWLCELFSSPCGAAWCGTQRLGLETERRKKKNFTCSEYPRATLMALNSALCMKLSLATAER